MGRYFLKSLSLTGLFACLLMLSFQTEARSWYPNFKKNDDGTLDYAFLSAFAPEGYGLALMCKHSSQGPVWEATFNSRSSIQRFIEGRDKAYVYIETEELLFYTITPHNGLMREGVMTTATSALLVERLKTTATLRLGVDKNKLASLRLPGDVLVRAEQACREG